ncbi:40s ribosomal protein s2-like, partial [Lynx pardinus]
DEVLKIRLVQKQIHDGQWTRFKALVAIGDYNRHVILSVKCSKELATAIHGAINLAKLSIYCMCQGYWENNISKPHTVPCKMDQPLWFCACVLHPCPRGIGIVPKKLLMMSGTDNGYTSTRGCTATLDNFTKAICDAMSKTYSNLTPHL